MPYRGSKASTFNRFMIKFIKTSVMLLVTACSFTFMSCEKNDDDFDNGKQEEVNVKDEKVIVKEDGTVSGSHVFSAIDDKNFFIDYIKYSVIDGHLEVTGYDKAAFSGEAKFISELSYKGNEYKVVKIGYSAFRECESLTSVVVPNSVTEIGKLAFGMCENITTVTIGNSVKTICQEAFRSCDGLTSVALGNSVEEMQTSAFEDCSSLSTIVLPNSMQIIGKSVFEGCKSLTKINIPNSVTKIGELAFQDAPITSVTIPNSVIEIGEYAFDGTLIASISIPSSVTEIGTQAFGSASLTSIEVAKDNPKYSSVNGALYDKEVTILYECPEGKAGKFEIPSSVKKIAEYAFEDCISLTLIDIPNSVTEIGRCGFYCCSSLTSINIPNSVTKIGDFALVGCSALTSITIPASVTEIGAPFFYECTSLKDVTCLSQTPPSFDGVFREEDKIDNLHVLSGCKSAYERDGNWRGSFKNIIEDAKE